MNYSIISACKCSLYAVLFHELMHSVKRKVCVLSAIVQLCSPMMDPWNRITLYPIFDVFIGPSLGNTGLHTSLCKMNVHPTADLHPLTLCSNFPSYTLPMDILLINFNHLASVKSLCPISICWPPIFRFLSCYPS